MFNTVWNRWYKLIYDANIALTKIPSCDFGNRDSYKNQLLGEVYFLRGWAYFELARLFANIPIIDMTTNNSISVNPLFFLNFFPIFPSPSVFKL